MIFHEKTGKFFLAVLLGILLCGTAYGEVYTITPGDDVVGQDIQVRSTRTDTLLTIGNHYGIGMHEMLEANPNLGLDEDSASQRMGSGRKVTVPTQFVLPPFRKGIVVNLPELRLYYFSSDGHYVYTYPVGLGRMEWRTPLANSSVVQKEVDPDWHVPASIRQHVLEETGNYLPAVVPAGPENPLGKYAMRLSLGNYLIHGTNQPWSIGKFVSSGCIRMKNEDVEELFHMVQVGTPVHIINYANKAGWQGSQLYLESQKPLHLNAPVGPLNPGSAKAILTEAAKSRGAVVDWGRANSVLAKSTGLPEAVSSSSDKGVLTLDDHNIWIEQ